MSDEIREQLSALIDDELSDVEQPLLLGRVQRDTELRECLGRYQLIGEVMRGIVDTTALGGVADRVRRALQQDVAGQVPDTPKQEGFNWWKPVAGFAVAASVALVAVLTVSSLRETATDLVPELASSQAGVPVVARVSDEQWDRIEPGIDKRLTGYLVNHNEYAASRGVQGVMPYVRIVGFENDQR